jgi:hypothetical protein
VWEGDYEWRVGKDSIGGGRDDSTGRRFQREDSGSWRVGKDLIGGGLDDSTGRRFQREDSGSCQTYFIACS